MLINRVIVFGLACFGSTYVANTLVAFLNFQYRIVRLLLMQFIPILNNSRKNCRFGISEQGAPTRNRGAGHAVSILHLEPLQNILQGVAQLVENGLLHICMLVRTGGSFEAIRDRL